MFNSDDIVKVLIPNTPGDGYDYRLTAPAHIGAFVFVNLRNKKEIGLVVGGGDSNLPSDKIKSAIPSTVGLQSATLTWLCRMSEYTMMSMGAVLRLVLNVPDAFAPSKTEQLYSYAGGGRMTEQRQSVADAFASNDNEPMGVNDIQNIARVSVSVINTMIKNKILVAIETRNAKHETQVDKYYDTKKVILNTEQQLAANAIETDGKFLVHVLDGITGSGKTQVYFDAAMRAYQSGKSVLLMMPEIALTAQFMTRFADRFGAPPVVWHSNLTSSKRRDIWRGVASGDIRIVVGTRSSLFLPWKNLGLIVVDEEHDGSYKQEEQGNYNARDMAILCGAIEKFPVVLASATPSLETMKNIANGKYKLSRLTSRFGGATLPHINCIDMRKETSDKKQEISFLSPTLCNAINETLNNKQQVMLFINRRGFAPIVQCKKCGWVAECPDCSSGMTYHKGRNSLLCHVCGRAQPLPSKCLDCGGEISTRGVGIEKIADEVNAKFPNARIALVSSDTVQSRQSLERLVEKMESGETDIIIGTQILAKGHHFPNLTLVGVVDADQGLFTSDFRAGEHTFGQLFQVAGRAGRGEIPGRVLLQTYQPEHAVLRAICTNDRDGFYANDLAARRAAHMPPFGRLIAIIVEAEKESVLQDYCKRLSACAPILNGGKILGPIAAQMYQVRNWYRMRFLVMGDERANLQPVIDMWLKKVKQPVNMRVKIDVDPINFM